VVAGKGGVGKSTVAAAIALDAVGKGRRTLVVELAGRSDVYRILGGRPRDGGRAETELAAGLFHISIERDAVLEDYLEHEVPGPFPGGRIARSRSFSTLVDAAPGMGDLLAIGKVWELSQRPRRRRGARPYDLVVLDGPASGQLLGLLKAPRTFGTIARVGPIARQSADIDRSLRDPRLTGVIVVATPEQMAVSEALGLRDGLGSLEVPLDAAVLNKAVSIRFSRAEHSALQSAREDPAVANALWLADRARAQRRHIDHLDRELDGLSRARLPFVFEELDRAGIARLAGHLDRL
jgi:anion-transporting  ArsA/GET3 family ATPase